MTNMTKDKRDQFLRETRIGTLVTLNADGSPNALPLWYDWDGEKIRMFSSRDAGKVRRLIHDPRACLSVADPVGAKEAWVTVEGTVAIEDQGGRELACASITIEIGRVDYSLRSGLGGTDLPAAGSRASWHSYKRKE